MSLEGGHVHAGPAADLHGELVHEVRLARLGDEQADKAVGTGPGDDEDVKDSDRRSVLGPRRVLRVEGVRGIGPTMSSSHDDQDVATTGQCGQPVTKPSATRT